MACLISKKDNPVEWSLIIYDLDELEEHLTNFIEDFHSKDQYDEEEYKIKIGHLYAHLNRIYNSRNHIGEISDEEFEKYSNFPLDIKPVG